MRAVGDRAVDLAGAVDRMRSAALDPAAMNMARLDQADADVAGDAAHRLAPADDTRDRRFVHAVLQRDDITTRRQILADQQCRPVGVVGFGADKGYVDRSFLREMLSLGQMQSPHLDRKRLFAFVVGDAQAVLLHLLDMRRPKIDEGHILAGARHVRSGVTAHRAHADDRDPFAHNSSPHIPQAPAGWLMPILAPHPDRSEHAVRALTLYGLVSAIFSIIKS